MAYWFDTDLFAFREKPATYFQLKVHALSPEMNALSKAIRHLKAILLPAVGFTSGVKIYWPKEADRSPEASIKRQTITEANRLIEIGDAMVSGRQPAAQIIDQNLFARVDDVLANDAEQGDFIVLARAMEDIVVAANRCVDAYTA